MFEFKRRKQKSTNFGENLIIRARGIDVNPKDSIDYRMMSVGLILLITFGIGFKFFKTTKHKWQPHETSVTSHIDLPDKDSAMQPSVGRSLSVAKENISLQRGDLLAGDHAVLARLKGQRGATSLPSKLSIEDPEVSTANNRISADFTLKNRSGEPYKGRVCLVAEFHEEVGTRTGIGNELQRGGKAEGVISRQHCLDYHVSHFVQKSLQIIAPKGVGKLVDVKLVTTTSDDETFYHPLLAH